MNHAHPWLARIYDVMVWPTEWAGVRKARAAVANAHGLVLEVGVGTGLNLRHYQHVRELVCVEPDPFMLARAQRRVRKPPFPVTLVRAAGEQLPFATGTFDAVVITLVLCTVQDPSATVAEIRRVIKPGGRLSFVEHVESSSAFLSRVQHALTPAWKRMAGGCHLNRDSVTTLIGAGFRLENMERGQRGILVHGTATAD